LPVSRLRYELGPPKYKTGALFTQPITGKRMPYVQIDVETFCELVELTREKLTALTNSCTDIFNLPLHVKIYGPITLEGQWMDKHGN
jgi:hypothetical protein